MSRDSTNAVRGFMLAVFFVTTISFTAARAYGPSKRAMAARDEVVRMTNMLHAEEAKAEKARQDEAAAKKEHNRIQPWLEKEYRIIEEEGWYYDVKTDTFSPKKTESKVEAKVLPTGDRHTMLASACGPDEKCICINHAIFKHDSSWATAGVGKRANNPCNMRVPATWKPSVSLSSINSVNGKFAKFKTLEDGVTACVELYQRLYSELPAATLVKRWTDGGGNGAYHQQVANCYT